jgi:hypothetical protein
MLTLHTPRLEYALGMRSFAMVRRIEARWARQSQARQRSAMEQPGNIGVDSANLSTGPGSLDETYKACDATEALHCYSESAKELRSAPVQRKALSQTRPITDDRAQLRRVYVMNQGSKRTSNLC